MYYMNMVNELCPNVIISKDWRYGDSMGITTTTNGSHNHVNPSGEENNDDNNNDQEPKLEDFLGCCYSNSPENDHHYHHHHHSHEPQVDPESTAVPKINVNLSPATATQAQGHDLIQMSYAQPLIPGESGGNTYRSWLGQTLPYQAIADSGVDHRHQQQQSSGGGSFQGLALTMSPGAQNSGAITPLQVVAENRKRSGNGKSVVAKEPVPRKSIDTFGQRTSQYRGVTR